LRYGPGGAGRRCDGDVWAGAPALPHTSRNSAGLRGDSPIPSQNPPPPPSRRLAGSRFSKSNNPDFEFSFPPFFFFLGLPRPSWAWEATLLVRRSLPLPGVDPRNEFNAARKGTWTTVIVRRRSPPLPPGLGKKKCGPQASANPGCQKKSQAFSWAGAKPPADNRPGTAFSGIMMFYRTTK